MHLFASTALLFTSHCTESTRCVYPQKPRTQWAIASECDSKLEGTHMKKYTFWPIQNILLLSSLVAITTMFWSRGNSGHIERSADEWMLTIYPQTWHYRFKWHTEMPYTDTHIHNILFLSVSFMLCIRYACYRLLLYIRLLTA